jgi:hypothetical protein
VIESKCVVCHDKPAAFRCIQCHKPACADCAFKTENGAFCGRECATNYRDFARAQARAPKGKGGLLKPLIGLIIIAAIVIVAIKVFKPELLPF